MMRSNGAGRANRDSRSGAYFDVRETAADNARSQVPEVRNNLVCCRPASDLREHGG